MLTFIFVAAGLILVVGLVILAMNSGTRGGRHDQSAESEVNKQVQTQTGNPRGDKRATGSADD